MAIEELNIKLVYEFDGSENWKDEDDIWVPVCPTSAHSGMFSGFYPVLFCSLLKFI